MILDIEAQLIEIGLKLSHKCAVHVTKCTCLVLHWLFYGAHENSENICGHLVKINFAVYDLWKGKKLESEVGMKDGKLHVREYVDKRRIVFY